MSHKHREQWTAAPLFSPLPLEMARARAAVDWVGTHLGPGSAGSAGSLPSSAAPLAFTLPSITTTITYYPSLSLSLSLSLSISSSSIAMALEEAIWTRMIKQVWGLFLILLSFLFSFTDMFTEPDVWLLIVLLAFWMYNLFFFFFVVVRSEWDPIPLAHS